MYRKLTNFSVKKSVENLCGLPKAKQLICSRAAARICLLTPSPFHFIKQYCHMPRVFDENRMSAAAAVHKIWNNHIAFQ